MSMIVFMDGVMRNENKVPIFEGISLYKALNANATVMLACEDEEEAIRWSTQHKLTEVDGYLSDKSVGEYENKDFLKIQQQAAKAPIYFVVTDRVDLATTCLENGVRCLLFVHPVYMSGKFRPDGREGRKSWDELMGELDRQIDLRIKDKRI